MDLEMSLVESMSEEVMKDSIGRLYAVGVITDMSYWIARYTQVKHLDGLIVNMATVIKVNRGGSSISTVSAALDVLTQYGVITVSYTHLGQCMARSGKRRVHQHRKDPRARRAGDGRESYGCLLYTSFCFLLP